MADLSPITQAVWAAAWEECPVQCGDIQSTRRNQIAAAIKALADEVVPEPDDWDKDNFSLQALRLRCLMRDQMLRVVTELRDNNPTREGD
jgi:hypothetical protein